MAIIPSNTQFRGDTTGVTIVEKGSTQTNDRAGIFTMQDFIDTTGGLSGSGTIGKVAKFTATDAIGDGLIDDNGTSVNNTGAGGIITNTAFGVNALLSNTTGSSNVASGYNSLRFKHHRK